VQAATDHAANIEWPVAVNSLAKVMKIGAPVPADHLWRRMIFDGAQPRGRPAHQCWMRTGKGTAETGSRRIMNSVPKGRNNL
jgi:hypothetical protein